MLNSNFSTPPPHPPELVFQSIEETLLQPVLKSFITVFIQCNVGLENKLIRAPLLGLGKSIYYVQLFQVSLKRTQLTVKKIIISQIFLFAENSVITHLCITIFITPILKSPVGPCDLIGFNLCDLFTNRTIFSL